MGKGLVIYNSISRKKEEFKPINPPFVGLYVCGPTVYNNAHLGNARPGITFDVLYRYLEHLGYKVRYVRNITDVGHLEGDADEGEDKMLKKAKLEQLEPMEIAQKYLNSYHEDMAALNILPPNIEPRATGHIPEQIEMIVEIMKNGFAYEKNGSVYFDVITYNKVFKYGELSGREIDDLISGSRELNKQEEKKNPLDFALWKKAESSHLMRWKSPWGEGFPGWHLECSAMSIKYLGLQFDIHGGGMDLLFPHHECEIAQSVGAYKQKSVKYWVHNNMITLNGQKMAKSLGNAISLKQFFSGDHPLLSRSYQPMVIRFFILQAHYRSTLDFSTEALEAAEKGFKKLMEAFKSIKSLPITNTVDIVGVGKIEDECKIAMSDDFNTPIVIANLFEAVKIINNIKDGKSYISKKEHADLEKLFDTFLLKILGLKPLEQAGNGQDALNNVMKLVLELRNIARNKKDFEISDKIRDELLMIGIEVKDGKEGTSWDIKN